MNEQDKDKTPACKDETHEKTGKLFILYWLTHMVRRGVISEERAAKESELFDHLYQPGWDQHLPPELEDPSAAAPPEGDLLILRVAQAWVKTFADWLSTRDEADYANKWADLVEEFRKERRLPPPDWDHTASPAGCLPPNLIATEETEPSSIADNLRDKWGIRKKETAVAAPAKSIAEPAPTEAKCKCGAETAKTTHADWCPVLLARRVGADQKSAPTFAKRIEATWVKTEESEPLEKPNDGDDTAEPEERQQRLCKIDDEWRILEFVREYKGVEKREADGPYFYARYEIPCVRYHVLSIHEWRSLPVWDDSQPPPE